MGSRPGRPRTSHSQAHTYRLARTPRLGSARIGWPGDVPGRRRRRRGGARRRRSRSRVATRLRAGAALHGRGAVPADVGRGVPGEVQPLGRRRRQPAPAARRGAGGGRGTHARPGLRRPVSGTGTGRSISGSSRSSSPGPRSRRGAGRTGRACAARRGSPPSACWRWLIDAFVRLPLLVLRPRSRRPRRGGAPARGGGARERRRAARPGRRRPHRLRPGAARRRLRRPAVLVLLPLQRLALDLLRRQRPRGRLGAGHGLPGRDEPPATCAPAWVAFSSHDFTGDDLRRRWDDPDLRRGRPPGGLSPAPARTPAPSCRASTSSRSSCPALRPVVNWLSTPGGGWLPGRATPTSPGVRHPLRRLRPRRRRAIGPGHERPGSRILIDDDTPWVRDYRGLWGLDTHDRFGGERAPAGPRYERTARSAARGPTRWAGPGSTACPRRRRRRTSTGAAYRADRRRPQRARKAGRRRSARPSAG